MKVTQAYLFALDPTEVQAEALLSHCGAARFTFNWAVARVKAALSQREAERTYGVADRLLTEAPWNLYALRRVWNQAKDQAAPWWPVTAEIERAQQVPAQPDMVIGVDLGVVSLAVLSDGHVIANPKHHRAALRKLRRCNKRLARRQGPRSADGGRREPSRRWRKAKATVSKAHTQVGSQRRDSLHKLTTRLAANYGTIVAEDLHVAGMLRNRRPARSIADAGMAEIRRQLTYKTLWHGGNLVLASRWYPSSKTCSSCGVVKAKLSLAERLFTCAACGMSLIRDLNSAKNLAALAADVAESCAETLNARRGAVRPGSNARHAPPKREPRPNIQPGERLRRKA